MACLSLCRSTSQKNALRLVVVWVPGLEMKLSDRGCGCCWLKSTQVAILVDSVCDTCHKSGLDKQQFDLKRFLASHSSLVFDLLN